eukprot:jgi/Ulvmu1/10527/UM064_0065.1
MTASRRVQNAKSASYHKNVLKRGDPSVKAANKEKAREGPRLGPLVIGFFFFVVVGSSILHFIRSIGSR